MIGNRTVGSWVLSVGLGLGTVGAQDLGQEQGFEVPSALQSQSKVEAFAPDDAFVQVGPIKTHVVRRGESGRPVVLIHGFGSNTYTWRQNLEPLGERFRVFAFDLKGFGLTEKPNDGQYHQAAYVEHLLGLLDVFELERPVLVGNSMGGAVALELALRFPERVGGLVLVDSVPLGIAFQAGRMGQQAEAIEEAENASERFRRLFPGLGRGVRVSPVLVRGLITRSLVERGLKASFHDPSRVTPEMVDAYYLPITIEGAPEALAAMLSRPVFPRNEPLPPLSALQVPVLIVWGRHDRLIPVVMAQLFSQAIPGARTVIFENSGHLPHEEEPEAFNLLVSEFVNEIE